MTNVYLGFFQTKAIDELRLTIDQLKLKIKSLEESARNSFESQDIINNK